MTLFDFYTNGDSITWGLPGYILLVSCISVIGKKVGIKLFFSRKRYTQKKYYLRRLISAVSYHIIHEYTVTKVHIK